MRSTTHTGTGRDRNARHQFRSHAPLDRFDPTRTNVSPAIRKSISEITAIEAIVLTVDIRRSSSVLKESIDIPQYARILDDFVAEFRTVLGAQQEADFIFAGTPSGVTLSPEGGAHQATLTSSLGQEVPLLCMHELDVPGSLRRCIRILLNWNTEKTQHDVKHVLSLIHISEPTRPY